MKRLLLVPFLLLTALAVPVTVAAPAHAKGATKVVVEGPGMETVKLRLYTRRTDDVDLGVALGGRPASTGSSAPVSTGTHPT